MAAGDAGGWRGEVVFECQQSGARGRRRVHVVARHRRAHLAEHHGVAMLSQPLAIDDRWDWGPGRHAASGTCGPIGLQLAADVGVGVSDDTGLRSM